MAVLALAIGSVLLAAPGVDDLPARRPVPSPRASTPALEVERGTTKVDGLDLKPLPGGGFEHVDREGGFVATIDRDGGVEFRPLARVRRSRSGAVAWFQGLADALQRSPGDRDRPDLVPEMPQRDDTSRRAFASAQTVNYGPYGPPPIMMSVGGTFDVNGPNEAAQRAFMRRTKRMRDAMAVRSRERRLDAAAMRVTADVVAIWKDASVPLSIRKQRIFALWDEAEAPTNGDGPLQEKLEETELEVRTRIETAVRRLAPLGSESAFTATELRELNASRRGRARFEPYRAPSSAKTRE